MTSGPMKYGQLNDSGTDRTDLRSNGGLTLFVQDTRPYSGTAILAMAANAGILAHSAAPPGQGQGHAVIAQTAGDGMGVSAFAGYVGVLGVSRRTDVYGTGVLGSAFKGVLGLSGADDVSATGVHGSAIGLNANGVVGEANKGRQAVGVLGKSSEGWAGKFSGRVRVFGPLIKSGGGFQIDHPLDPENRYLSHSFVESPTALNTYQGNVVTDANGDATVTLPDYFEALNENYCYQLTPIGQFAQAMVAEEIRDNQFTITTDRPDVKVSWQVTGVRRDPFATTYPMPVEEEKPTEERGTYLHPEAYGKPASQGVNYQREIALTEARAELLEQQAQAERVQQEALQLLEREAHPPQEPPDEQA